MSCTVERVLRRVSEKGVSRRCLGRPLGEYDPLGVHPAKGEGAPEQGPRPLRAPGVFGPRLEPLKGSIRAF